MPLRRCRTTALPGRVTTRNGRRRQLQRQALRAGAGRQLARAVLQQGHVHGRGPDPADHVGRAGVRRQELSGNGQYGFAFAGANTYEGTWQFMPWMWSNGGTRSKLELPAERPGAAASSPAWSRTAPVGRALSAGDRGMLSSQFAAGKAAMMENGPWQIPSLQGGQGSELGLRAASGERCGTEVAGAARAVRRTPFRTRATRPRGGGGQDRRLHQQPGERNHDRDGGQLHPVEPDHRGSVREVQPGAGALRFHRR